MPDGVEQHFSSPDSGVAILNAYYDRDTQAAGASAQTWAPVPVVEEEASAANRRTAKGKNRQPWRLRPPR